MRIHKLQPGLRPAGAALFLDVDGTLIEFGPAPDEVEVDAATLKFLQDASDTLGGALALISGRSLAQLDALFGHARFPAAGLHGMERRDARGRLHVHPAERLPQALVDELGEIAERHPGVLLEDKGRAVALHYRQAASLHEMLHREVEVLARRHGGDDLQVQPGAYVLELKPSGITKAHAIEAFMLEHPFAGRTPLFAGDDLTDLHGFAAVERLGGVSIAVGPRVSAQVEIATPQALRDLLAEFLARGATA
ncbi:MAG TPA: trehalose-phosphatase [Steroidobacteraceae bacterium]|nr:trehalose-phosphatase [Steroidobacteraceae bacterium]